MGKGNTTSNNLLKLIFNATAWANIADNAASLPDANLLAALHTADPGASGTQNTSEIGYTGYTRVMVVRTSSGWTAASAQSTSPVASITFPPGTGGSGTASFFSIGTPLSASVTCTSAAPGVFTDTAHGMTQGMPFFLGGTTAPTGLTLGTIYFASNITTNTYTASTTYANALTNTGITTSSTGTAVTSFHGNGASTILYSGTVTPNIVTGNGVTPSLTTASTVTEA